MKKERVIAIRDFHGSGQHVYEDQLGFNADIRKETRSNVAKDIFVKAIDEWLYEICIYYIDNGTYYYFTPMEVPMQVLIIPRHPEWSRFISFQIENDTYGDGEVIATYNSAKELWDNFRIDGKSLEEVIPRSYVVHFT